MTTTAPPEEAVGTGGPGQPALPGSAEVVDAGPARTRRRRWFRYTLPGAYGALLFICLSFTPSLLPRPGTFQGFVCGVNGAIGYAAGVLAAFVWRSFADRPARTPSARTWQIFAGVAGAALIISYLFGLRWQTRLRDLMQVPGDAIGSQLLLPLVAVVFFVALIAAARGVRGLYHWTSERLSRWMGRSAARGLGWIVVAAAALLLVNGVLVDGIVSTADRVFSVKDRSTNEDAVQPDTTLRSGGPGSLISWDSLGYQGRNFTGQGPTVGQISSFTGTAALEPIRAYAGFDSAEDVERRAVLAVDDLERAGGFDRAYLLVAGTTGTGWVDPGALASLEYETGGDVASVAIQYSHLPSWLSFLVDQVRARQAGRALFDTVYERWNNLPAETRPKLLVFGESLGSFSADAAFSGEADLRNRTDGALFAGAPNFNPMLREFTDGRDAGSPQIEPVFRDGRTVRFSSDPGAPITPESAPWNGTHVLYLQHPSDPVSWWSTDLITGRPDWLREQRGRDVLDEMTWIPVVTFWQLTADMLEPVDVPAGHGHRYTREYVDAWALILEPEGWTAEKAEQLRDIIAPA